MKLETCSTHFAFMDALEIILIPKKRLLMHTEWKYLEIPTDNLIPKGLRPAEQDFPAFPAAQIHLHKAILWRKDWVVDSQMVPFALTPDE